MRQIVARGATGLVALIFVSGLLSPVAAVSSGAAAQDADITITFRGLMVFDDVVTGGVQVVRLHHDAEMDHTVNIRVTGPDFPNGVDWGLNLPKGVMLNFEVVAERPVPPSARFLPEYKPFNINRLHPPSGSDGDFRRIPNAFGPIFTFKAGTFEGKSPVNMNFVNRLGGKHEGVSVRTFVEATISLETGQAGYLSGDGMDDFPLTKPEGKQKWHILVSNEPLYRHACGYHFREYYRGFDYTMSGPVHALRQYDAVSTTTGDGPCDPHSPHFQSLTLNQLVTSKQARRHDQQEKKGIPTRPCIPLGY